MSSDPQEKIVPIRLEAARENYTLEREVPYTVISEGPSTFLSREETIRKRKLIKIVDRGLGSFIEVGNALLELRDSRLYRNEYSSFDAFCRDRWDLSKTSANRLIGASDVAKNVSECCRSLMTPMGVKPTSERQVRSLTDLSPEDQRKVWEVAVKESRSGTPTAKEVEAAKTKVVPVSRNTRRDTQRPTVAALSLKDTIIHLGAQCAQYVKSVLKEIDERAADEEDRQHLAVVLLEDLDRLRKQIEDYFSQRLQEQPTPSLNNPQV